MRERTRRLPSPRATARDVLLVATVALAYFAAAELGLRFATIHPSATAVWPPAGIALATVLVYGRRAAFGVALGAFAANTLAPPGPIPAIGIALGNTAEALLGAWLVGRYAGGRAALDSAPNLVRFALLAAGLSTLVSATIGVTSLALDGAARWRDFGAIWTTWWLGDAMGDLVVAPPILLWLRGAPPRAPRRPLAALAAFGLVAATGFGFLGGFGGSALPTAWFWLPVVVWIAYLFGQRAATTTIFLMSGLLVWGTSRGIGPFVLDSPEASLLVLQGYLAVGSLMALLLSAGVASRRRALEELARARADLEERVRDRTRELSHANEALRSEIRERLRLERELIDAGEHERRRLGWDLHDDLGQLLTGIEFLSSAAESRLRDRAGDEAANIREIGSLVREAIEKTRRLSLGLTPVSLGTGGLMTAVRELAEMTERVFDVSCVVEYDARVMVERPLAATNLYRIAQEAVSNAVRHGGGRRIGIGLSLRPEGLVLAICDDGAGIGSSDSERAGLGLRIMKYRAEMIGGTLEIESGSRGTSVVCVVPHVARIVPAGEPGPAHGGRESEPA